MTVRVHVDTSEDRMSQQTIKQQARRTAREMAEKRRKEREERERRVIDLAEQVMVAIGERDAAVAETEKRAGEALRELTEAEPQADDGDQGGNGAALASAGSGGAGAGSSAG